MNINLSTFHTYAFSDYLDNVVRGALGNYIVATALGITEAPASSWEPYDLSYQNLKIEVKTSAYLQTWFQSKLSLPTFDIAAKQGWNSQTNEWTGEVKRYADVHVLCLFKAQDKSKAKELILNTDHWQFYVLPTGLLPEQKSIGLSALEKLAEAIPYTEILNQIDKMAVGTFVSKQANPYPSVGFQLVRSLEESLLRHEQAKLNLAAFKKNYESLKNRAKRVRKYLADLDEATRNDYQRGMLEYLNLAEKKFTLIDKKVTHFHTYNERYCKDALKLLKSPKIMEPSQTMWQIQRVADYFNSVDTFMRSVADMQRIAKGHLESADGSKKHIEESRKRRVMLELMTKQRQAASEE